MSKLREIFNQKKFFNIFIIILFIIMTSFIASKWCGTETGKHTAKEGVRSSKSGETSSVFKFFKSIIGKGEQEQGNDMKKIDPKLKDVKIIEIPVDQPDKEPDDPEERRIKALIAIMIEPMESVKNKFTSFIYEGEMNATTPRFNDDIKSYRKGKRFGKSDKIYSRFVYRKDKYGNFHIHQETRCSRKGTKYDTEKYNGDFYFVNKDYTYVDADGSIGDESKVKSVLATMKRDRKEPLARRNWIHIIKDLDLVIGLEKLEEEDSVEFYSIKGINPKKQKWTIKIRHLSGKISILNTNHTMVECRIDGDVKNMRGFMVGSNNTYSITMRLYDIGKVSTISAP